eukprot:TRINITY_DN2066_c0_g1_i3.p1 TRINITY_DN2066_c0_g1~~TRINITY_DN2066_c0_g1_i3.p1  ORF type:complete len:664 (-),score=136.84 TRINITY_DN2066_c0_g1_i3:76-2067(-)
MATPHPIYSRAYGTCAKHVLISHPPRLRSLPLRIYYTPTCLLYLYLLCTLLIPVSYGSSLPTFSLSSPSTHPHIPADPSPVGGNITIPVPFTGGPRCDLECGVDDGVQTTRFPSYACSDGTGNWQNGMRAFPDPIPPNQGFILRQIYGTIWGRFYCDTTNPGVMVTITLQSMNLNFFELPTIPANCTCPNCAVPRPFAPFIDNPSSNPFPLYRYQQTNVIAVEQAGEFNGTFCLSQIDLTLVYGPVSYSVKSLYPTTGQASGGTVVTVMGSKFFSSLESVCRFGTITVQASVINSTTMTCVSPPSPSTSTVTVYLEVSEDGNVWTFNKVPFTYTVTQPAPSLSLLMWVAIGVCAVSVIFVLIAGYLYTRRNKLAATSTETEKLLNSAQFQQYGNVRPIDMSEIQVHHRIGRGSCAEVYVGTWHGTTVAIKKAKIFTEDDEDFLNELSQEASILSTIRHPNVLQFLGTANNPPEIVIVTEYMARGSLYRLIHDKNMELSWHRIRNMALDVAKGMNYLHCCDPVIIHRDLKSHNLLVDEHFKVKVCDFGLSTMMKQRLDKKTAMTPVGTPCWTAPEVLRNETYTEKADVFSYGVVLWELCTREDPYAGMPTFQIVIAVGQHKMRPVVPPTTPAEMAQLMTECWNESYADRPSFSSIVQRLEKMRL